MYEASVGGKLFQKVEGELSVYHTQIANPIIYVADGSNDNYLNRNRAGTQGIDFWTLYRSKKNQLKFSASYYEVIKESDFAEIQVHHDEKSYWGMPNYRVGLQYSHHFESKWSVHMASIMQDQFNLDYQPDRPVKNGPVINLSVSKMTEKVKNLRFNIGVTNLLNSEYWIGSPYSSQLSIMPIYQRQFCVSVQYKLD
jgi:outer membrane receptor protein involved in Fe transport